MGDEGLQALHRAHWNFTAGEREWNITRVSCQKTRVPDLRRVGRHHPREHPHCKLTIEEGDEEEWETLLISVTTRLKSRYSTRSVADGSVGQDEIADFLEDLKECKPESGVAWLDNYLASVKTIYAFSICRERFGRGISGFTWVALGALGTRELDYSGRS